MQFHTLDFSSFNEQANGQMAKWISPVGHIQATFKHSLQIGYAPNSSSSPSSSSFRRRRLVRRQTLIHKNEHLFKGLCGVLVIIEPLLALQIVLQQQIIVQNPGKFVLEAHFYGGVDAATAVGLQQVVSNAVTTRLDERRSIATIEVVVPLEIGEVTCV